MICNVCKQDSIEVRSNIIICSSCQTVLSEINDSYLCRLIIYNKSLEEAFILGGKSFLEEKPISPYQDNIDLHCSWEDGYNKEKESYDNEALSLSYDSISNGYNRLLKDNDTLYYSIQLYDNFKIGCSLLFGSILNRGRLRKLLCRMFLGNIFKNLRFLVEYSDSIDANNKFQTIEK
jgi:hypothetical protein